MFFGGKKDPQPDIPKNGPGGSSEIVGEKDGEYSNQKFINLVYFLVSEPHLKLQVS